MQQDVFLKPPNWIDSEGKPRRAGFEFELGNLTIEDIADAIHKRFGGRLNKISAFEVNLIESELGKIKIERDTQMLTSLKYREWLSSIGIDFSDGAEGDLLEREVDKLSRWLVPCEIVTEPLEFEQFSSLNDLVTVLNTQKAEGTHVAIYYAFGLHINASVPDLTSDTLLAYLQAFLLSVDWIIQDAHTDFSRRFLTKYIDPFPETYVQRVLDIDYRPDIDELMKDYLEFNSTRNRPLDMLPIFSMINAEAVQQAVDEDEKELVKGRPAFHYRLPDCKVGAEGWSVAAEWNRWKLVETLADDNRIRHELMKQWIEDQSSFKLFPNFQWAAQVERFIKSERLI